MRTKLLLSSLQANFFLLQKQMGLRAFWTTKRIDSEHLQVSVATCISHLHFYFILPSKTTFLLECLQGIVMVKFIQRDGGSWGEPASSGSCIIITLCCTAHSVTLPTNLPLSLSNQHKYHVEMQFSLFEGLNSTLYPWGAGSPDWCPPWVTQHNSLPRVKLCFG